MEYLELQTCSLLWDCWNFSDPTEAKGEDLSTRMLVAEEEPEHTEAKAKDLSTGPLLMKEGSTVDGGVTEVHEGPSSVQTEDSKQQPKTEHILTCIVLKLVFG